MPELYATLIINKRYTINDVPEKHKISVKEILSNRGFDEDGNILNNR